MKNKSAQITVFVAIAILIVVGVAFYFYARTYLLPVSLEKIPEKLRPVEETFLTCLETVTEQATIILGQQAGHLELPETIQASSYMPFTNKQSFLGREVPYWFYISGNGLEKTQIPTVTEMEKQLENYIAKQVEKCSLAEYEKQGFTINKGNAKAFVRIRNKDVSITLYMPLKIELKEENLKKTVGRHDISLPIRLKKLYEIAKDTLEAENSQLFLEQRTIDAIFLYEELPSSESTLECYPKKWQIQEVQADLKEILTNNIPFTKIKGTDYEKTDHYFEIEIPSKNLPDKSVTSTFLPLTNPFKLEVYPEENGQLTGESISQTIPAFLRSFLCLSNYNFVYDIAYPVLVILQEKESGYTFQFPLVVIIDNNQPRKATQSEDLQQPEVPVCKYKLATETVFTSTIEDNRIVPLEDTAISFKCLNTVCPIGRTTMQPGGAGLTETFPQCINGFIIAEKQGYVKAEQQISTNIDNMEIELILEPLQNLDLELKIIGSKGTERSLTTGETALISLREEEKELQNTLLYPENKLVQLTSGVYEVEIQLYKEQKLELEKQSIETCQKVPKSGLLGMLGIKEERCQTLEVPSLELEQVLFGGTSFSWFLTQEELQGKTKLTLYSIERDMPETVEELNEIFIDIRLNSDSPLFSPPELT